MRREAINGFARRSRVSYKDERNYIRVLVASTRWYRLCLHDSFPRNFSSKSANSPPTGGKLSPDKPSATTDPDATSISTLWNNSPMPPLKDSPKEPSPTSSNVKPTASEIPLTVPTAVCAAPFLTSHAPGNGPAAPSPTTNPSRTAPPVGGFFFPQRPLLRLNNHAYSTAAWRQIIDAAAYFPSFADAAHSLNHQANPTIAAAAHPHVGPRGGRGDAAATGCQGG